MIVVDASALIELLLPSDAAGTIAARLFNSSDSLAAPHLIDVETVRFFAATPGQERSMAGAVARPWPTSPTCPSGGIRMTSC